MTSRSAATIAAYKPEPEETSTDEGVLHSQQFGVLAAAALAGVLRPEEPRLFSTRGRTGDTVTVTGTGSVTAVLDLRGLGRSRSPRC